MWFASQVTELLLRNRASVNYGEFFRAPCRKNYALHQKITPFLMGTTSSITEQSLGKIAQCVPAVGAKMWCLFFFFAFLFFCFFCHALSPEHRAFEGCIVWTSIALPFTARFQPGFQRFFASDCSFRCTT